MEYTHDRNTRSVKQLWDAVAKATDYRGVVFGMNDAGDHVVGGSSFDLAYYAFHDPAYAPFIRLAGTRDLIYGIPDLPTDDPKLYEKSGYALNIGYTLLRSQTTDRDPSDQIQAVLKTGSHGGYHGHFDRTALDSLSRYGQKFYNPEVIWWGYKNYLYKFYIQTSDSHNMVVVDQKQQEAVQSFQLMFHSGKMMQAAAAETDARWSDPPYGGMLYFPDMTFADQMRKNEQSIPLVTDRKYGELGPFSDRVVQRRLAVVTDDYALLADYLKSAAPHTFDNLFQMQGFGGLDGADKTLLRHDGQMNDDPRSSAQFITDCDWYRASAPTVAHFTAIFGPGSFYPAGVLKEDIHSLWPPTQEIMVGAAPEPLGTNQWVTYSVSGDGKTLAKGESGVWILGQVNVDVPVAGVKQLSLLVNSDANNRVKKALFWSNPRMVLASGAEVPIAAASTVSNVALPAKAGADYYGGPIKIAGELANNSLPTQPLDPKNAAMNTIDLTGKSAVRFRATLGGDFPLGDDAQGRKVYSIRTQGTEARYLTVIEPYQDAPIVKSAVALDANTVRVDLADGRVQTITIPNLEGDGHDISVKIDETGGASPRTETTTSAH